MNGGEETALDLKIMTRVYVDTADDRAAQLKLASKFEEEWRSTSKGIPSNPFIEPGHPAFGTIHRTLTNEEVADLSPPKTIYAFIRFEYSDGTGNWRTDTCVDFQREPTGNVIDAKISHPCLAFTKFRYAVRRR